MIIPICLRYYAFPVAVFILTGFCMGVVLLLAGLGLMIDVYCTSADRIRKSKMWRDARGLLSVLSWPAASWRRNNVQPSAERDPEP
jgi:hypothetical protein